MTKHTRMVGRDENLSRAILGLLADQSPRSMYGITRDLWGDASVTDVAATYRKLMELIAVGRVVVRSESGRVLYQEGALLRPPAS